MRRSSIIVTVLTAVGLLAVASSGCAGKGPAGFNNASSGGSSGGTASSNGGSGGSGSNGGSSNGSSGGNPGMFGTSSSGGSGGPVGDGGMVSVCPPGLMCDVACPNNGTTTISGKVYDPAGKNPLFNIAVYVPATDLQPLPKGVPTGNDACNCGALFKSGAVTSTVTDETGSFTLTNAPVGSQVPLVMQVGKWRRQIMISTTACQDNPQADKSMKLPGTIMDANDSMPDIAVSTGGADSLECLMLRIGLPASEYVAGAAGTGHIHVFNGGDMGGGGGGRGGGRGGGGAGKPESNLMPGAPASSTDLWSSQDQLMPYDITLLSCEGGETYNANPQALEAYLNAGGRAFASHYHYAFFSGPIDTAGTATYMAPADWGMNLANWSDPGNGGGGQMNNDIGGVIDTTLNGSTMPFSKGVSLGKWLGNVGALGQGGVPAGELSIYQPRFNSIVQPTHKPSQPWITSDPNSGMAGQTMYFSFDTPVNLNPPTGVDPGGTAYCGRAVFSDLHVSGDPGTADTTNGIGGGGGGGTGGDPPPTGCDNVDLSPQEKALEFMLFDLSSCVLPDTMPPPVKVPPPPQ